MAPQDTGKKPQPFAFSRKPGESEKETARRVVARFSEGNIRLQMGRYLTAEDMEEERARLRQVSLRVENR